MEQNQTPKMTEELLFICERVKTCSHLSANCPHGVPHPFITKDDYNFEGCSSPCDGIPTKCKPYNINKRTEKQFAKFIVERLLK